MSQDQPIRLPDTNLKKPRRSAVARVFGWLVALAFISIIVFTGASMWTYASYTAPGPLKDAAIVDIPKNMDRVKVANLLHDRGVVSDPLVMGLAALVQGYRGAKLKSGEYEFPAGSSMAEVFNIIASGRVVTYKLTVPEGWTSEMAVNRMREHEAMKGEIAVVPPEGSVIANTYLFARGKDRQALLEEMVVAQAKLVAAIWARKPTDSIIKNQTELVTLASIVEKETAKPEERPRVAAVFLNRLKAGMRLQSDPTIIYGIVGGKGKLDRPIFQSDLDGETPYNTYKINGLPPGPIASPGKESLEAVINPALTPDLYFVADGTGGHVFAATLEGHNANVAKWRAIEAGTAQPVDPAAAAVVPAPEVPAVPQAQLPSVEEAAPAVPVANAGTNADAAVEAAAKNTKIVEQIPQTEAPEAKAGMDATPKPGTMVKVGKVLVPIPELKKATP